MSRQAGYSGRVTAVLCALTVLAGLATGQTLECSVLMVDQPYALVLSGGAPHMPFCVGIDQDPGPTAFPGVGTVALGFSQHYALLPPGALGADGRGAVGGWIHQSADAHTIVHAQALTVDPASAQVYVLSNPVTAGIHPEWFLPTSTEVLLLGDDDAIEVPFPAGMSFPFYGQSYLSVWVSSNGLLSFGAPWVSHSESLGALVTGPPKIAPLWDDFVPNLMGQVLVERRPGALRVVWEHVSEWHVLSDNHFAVALYADGSLAFQWESVGTEDGLVGVGAGELTSPYVPQVQDFSDDPDLTVSELNPPAERFFTFLPFDLQARRLTMKRVAGGWHWYR